MLDINKIIDIPPGAKRVLLQLPEGIMMRAIEIADALEKKGIDVILSAEPCYGACDLRIAEAKLCNADLIVHLGHNEFYRKIKTDIPVLYMPLEINADIKGIDFSAIKENRVGLLTAVQHLGMLDEIAERLKQAGKQAVIGGQILGCWIANARKIAKDVDAKEIVVLEGIPSFKEEINLFYYSTKKINLKVNPLKEGIIMGVTASLLLKAGKIPITCLFAETHSNLPDSEAAAKIVETLDGYLGFKIDVKPLFEQAKKFESSLKQYIEKSRGMLDQKQKKELSYFG